MVASSVWPLSPNAGKNSVQWRRAANGRYASYLPLKASSRGLAWERTCGKNSTAFPVTNAKQPK
jgi:hypothetical protein